MLQNELDLAEKQKQMNLMHRDQHLADKVQKEIKWQNQYGEQNPLPHVDWDLILMILLYKAYSISIKFNKFYSE